MIALIGFENPTVPEWGDWASPGAAYAAVPLIRKGDGSAQEFQTAEDQAATAEIKRKRGSRPRKKTMPGNGTVIGKK